MAVKKDDMMKYTSNGRDHTWKVRLLHKQLVKEVCDLTFSDEVIVYKNGDNVATHWDVVFDAIHTSDVRKWIKKQK